MYRTLAIITRGFYDFSIFSYIGFSLMFGSVTMTLGGYKTRAVIIKARLMMASVRYMVVTNPIILGPQFTLLQ